MFQFRKLAGLAASTAIFVAIAAPAAAQVRDEAAGREAATQGYALLEQGRADEAAEAARRAVEADPYVEDYRLLQVDALLRANRASEAYEILRYPREAEDYRVASRRAEAATRAGLTIEASSAWDAAARTAPDAESRAFALRSQILALLQIGDLDGARTVFDREWAGGGLRGPAPLDTANIAVAVGRDVEAQEAFRLAHNNAPLTGANALNAGYSARRIGDDSAAVYWFQLGLESWPVDPAFDEQRQFEIRREIETLQRRWGASASVSYGTASTVSSGVLGADTVLQAGGEAYYRIGGYNDGRPLDVFARVYGTLDSDLGGATGGDTAQGWIGLRYKPFSNANLILEASRMIALGDLARDDWMLRAAWSAEAGGDLRFDRSSWPAWRLYADVAHLVDAEQTLGVAEARAGQAFRTSDRDILTPFVFVRAYYDSLLADETAVGAGPGVAWRHWFRESDYGAPASYIDLSVGYQFSLSGDDRGEGVYLGLNLNY
jgi:tetratricopeptide (TPR) repeat protein